MNMPSSADDSDIRTSQRTSSPFPEYYHQGEALCWDSENDWYIYHGDKGDSPKWVPTRRLVLQDPGSQANADEPHPQAWTREEIQSRLARVNRIIEEDAIEYSDDPLDHPLEECDHPSFLHRLHCGLRMQWRKDMEAWLETGKVATRPLYDYDKPKGWIVRPDDPALDLVVAYNQWFN